MMSKKKASRILSLLSRAHPEARIALNFGNPHELLFAVMLSAQCTDVRVNTVTPALFSRFKSIDDYANAEIADIEEIIRSTGFFRQKALSIKKSAIMIQEQFGRTIPSTIEDLTMLPGVGRKTANVVLSNLHGINEGVVVDTHVKRVSNRLGMTMSSNPAIIERDLMKLYSPRDYGRISDLLIFHGRKVCNARRPKCHACILYNLCAYENKEHYKTNNIALRKDGKMRKKYI
jgi:endonuclease III